MRPLENDHENRGTLGDARFPLEFERSKGFQGRIPEFIELFRMLLKMWRLRGNAHARLHSIGGYHGEPRMTPRELERFADISDEALVRQICGGQSHLFEVLMRRHNPKVFRVIRSIVRSENEAEELMQDAYVRAYTHLAQFAERARFSTWLLRIALHEAWARAKRAGREVTVDPNESPVIAMTSDARATPEEELADAELRRILDERIDALPEAFRTVFVLREVEGLSVTETAETLGLPEETVRTRAFRARESLRASLRAIDSGAFREAYGFHLSRCDRVVSAVFRRVLGQ